MRLMLILLIFFANEAFCESAGSNLEAKNPLPIGAVYLKPELSGLAPVSSPDHPGSTFEDCKDHPDWCVTWPGADAEIINLPSVEPKTIATGVDSKTGETISDTFVFVSVKEHSKNGETSKEGWINARDLSAQKLTPILEMTSPVSELKTKNDENPTCLKSGINCLPALKNFMDVDVVRAKIGETKAVQLSTDAEALQGLVGRCPLTYPTDKDFYKSEWTNKNVYDESIMPQLRELKNQVPKLQKDNGEMMTWADLVNIDALSRTIYSEMNECFQDGLEFPMAAAKVAINRVKEANLPPPKNALAQIVFLKSSQQANDKPDLAKVLNADKQFSVWNYPTGPKDRTILMSLCPTKDADHANWMGSRPSQRELAIWRQSLQIATEAVLHQEEFTRKTENVKQLYYTSKREEYDNRTRPNPPPTIAGRSVNSYQCMYLWNGK